MLTGRFAASNRTACRTLSGATQVIDVDFSGELGKGYDPGRFQGANNQKGGRCAEALCFEKLRFANVEILLEHRQRRGRPHDAKIGIAAAKRFRLSQH